MSGALDLSHPLQSLTGLFTSDSSGGASTPPSNSSSQPVTATTAQGTTANSNTSSGKATRSGSAATSATSGVGGDPITTQAQPLDVSLQTPKDDMAQSQTATRSKNTNYVVSVPATGARPAPFEQTSQGWIVFGVAWYWWAVLIIGIATAAVLINRFLTNHEKVAEPGDAQKAPKLKQIIRL